jgi:hypothetical protein
MVDSGGLDLIVSKKNDNDNNLIVRSYKKITES